MSSIPYTPLSLPSSSYISEIIWSLKDEFREEHYIAAQRKLKDLFRQEKEAIECEWRERYDIMELQRSDSKLEVIGIQFKMIMLKNECKMKDYKIEDLKSELSLANEKEERAKRRYEELFDSTELEKEEVVNNINKEEVEELKRVVREKDEKMDKERAQFRSELMGLKEICKQKDGAINEITKNNEDLKDVVEEMKRFLMEKSDKIEKERAQFGSELTGLKEKCEQKDGEIVEIKENNRVLKDEVEKLKRVLKQKDEKVNVMEIENKKLDKNINELMKKVEGMESEKVNNSGITSFRELESRIMELEEKVVQWMMINVETDKQLGNSQIGKILADVIKGLDGHVMRKTKATTGFDDAGIVRCQALRTPEAQPKPGAVLENSFRETSHVGFGKDTFSAIVVLSDSDSDDAIPLRFNERKRKRPSSPLPLSQKE